MWAKILDDEKIILTYRTEFLTIQLWNRIFFFSGLMSPFFSQRLQRSVTTYGIKFIMRIFSSFTFSNPWRCCLARPQHSNKERTCHHSGDVVMTSSTIPRSTDAQEGHCWRYLNLDFIKTSSPALIGHILGWQKDLSWAGFISDPFETWQGDETLYLPQSEPPFHLF